eukprot:2535285-Prymnesium_polylepis.3
MRRTVLPLLPDGLEQLASAGKVSLGEGATGLLSLFHRSPALTAPLPRARSAAAQRSLRLLLADECKSVPLHSTLFIIVIAALVRCTSHFLSVHASSVLLRGILDRGVV